MRERRFRKRPPGGDNTGWMYAVPAVLSWSCVIATVLGVAFFPATWRWVAAIAGAALLAYLWVTIILATVTEVRCRRWARRDWVSSEDAVGSAGFAPADVHHAVIVPNYKEDMPVLERTLASLAAQRRAKDRMVLVLAMEGREPDSLAKARRLADLFRGRFERIVITVHPDGLPGELACKASNQSWGAAEAHRVMTGEMRIPIDRITLTTCDADSVFHRGYFDALAREFARDERRYARIWQVPMRYYNNLWDVPPPIRYSMWFIHAGAAAEQALPFMQTLPISTYSLSMRLAEQVEWWDPAVISEDWHIYLAALFVRDGDVSIATIFLPVSADATGGRTTRQALVNCYVQFLRHAWGAEDVGYVIKSAIEERRPPRAITVLRLLHVLRDHVVRVAGWCALASAPLVGALSARAASRGPEMLSGPGQMLASLLPSFVVAGSAGVACIILMELVRNPPPRHWSPLRPLTEIVLMWVCAPIIGLYLSVAPALHAQTKLMLGIPLYWKVTPKRLVERFSDAA